MAGTLQTLLNPLESGDQEAWREAVCVRIRRLTETDVVFFRLSDRGPTTIDPVGPLSAREAYRAQFRELDPWPRMETRPGETRVDTLERLIGESRLHEDPYYNEFAVPYGLRDYVGVQVGTTAGAHAHVGIFNSGRSGGPHRVGETMKRLSMVMPAFAAGLRAWLVADGADEDLGGVLDQIRDAVVLFDGSGRVLHANTALIDLLGRDPSASVLREGLAAAARELMVASSAAAAEPMANPQTLSITTLRGTYRISTVAAGQRLSHDGGALLVVDPPSPSLAPASTILARLRLDRQEAQIAVALATGMETGAIARRLGVTVTAARRCSARVMRKAGVTSRGQLHALLYP